MSRYPWLRTIAVALFTLACAFVLGYYGRLDSPLAHGLTVAGIFGSFAGAVFTALSTGASVERVRRLGNGRQ